MCFYLCVFVKKIIKRLFHLFLRSWPTAAQGLSANNWSRAAVRARASPCSPPPRTWLVINFVRRVPPVYNGATDRSEGTRGGTAKTGWPPPPQRSANRPTVADPGNSVHHLHRYRRLRVTSDVLFLPNVHCSATATTHKKNWNRLYFTRAWINR